MVKKTIPIVKKTIPNFLLTTFLVILSKNIDEEIFEN